MKKLYWVWILRARLTILCKYLFVSMEYISFKLDAYNIYIYIKRLWHVYNNSHNQFAHFKWEEKIQKVM